MAEVPAIEAALAALKPIQDLAKNWDIDIDHWLEEYLHETLDTDKLAPHLAGEKVNFAEAALILQNSSNVYSRKVEHLYNLVFKALENVEKKQNSRTKKSQEDIDVFYDFDPQQEFLLLDDVLPTDETDECQHINLNLQAEHKRRSSLGNKSILAATSLDVSQIAAKTLVNTLDTGSLRLVAGQCDVNDDGCLFMPGTQSRSQGSDNYRHNDMTMASNFDDGIDDDDAAGFAFVDDDEPRPQPDNPAAEDTLATKHVSFAPSLPEKNDPWRLLDPHKADKSKPRPLRIGKTIRLPPGMLDLPSDCVTGARTRRTKRPQEVPKPIVHTQAQQSIATRTFQATLRKRRHDESADDYVEGQENGPPTVPIKGLAYGEEFAYIAKATAKRKAAERRERRKLLQRQQQSQPQVAAFEEDEDDDFGFGDFDDGDDDHGGPDFDGDNTGLAASGVEEVYRPDDDEENDMDTTNIYAKTFEDLCRAHIQAFARGAEKYACETQLTRRVGDWQSKLAPILEREEQRTEFDIHVYGETVIGKLEEQVYQKQEDGKPKSRVVDFQDITQGCQQYEVCRMFLAALSLSNDGNVQLEETSDHNSLRLELLRSSIDRPMETYLAPSVTFEN